MWQTPHGGLEDRRAIDWIRGLHLAAEGNGHGSGAFRIAHPLGDTRWLSSSSPKTYFQS